jgi:K+ transporter
VLTAEALTVGPCATGPLPTLSSLPPPHPLMTKATAVTRKNTDDILSCIFNIPLIAASIFLMFNFQHADHLAEYRLIQSTMLIPDVMMQTMCTPDAHPNLCIKASMEA